MKGASVFARAVAAGEEEIISVGKNGVFCTEVHPNNLLCNNKNRVLTRARHQLHKFLLMYRGALKS